jgi:hypothetical protein
MIEHVLATACYALSIVYYTVALGRLIKRHRQRRRKIER